MRVGQLNPVPIADSREREMIMDQGFGNWPTIHALRNPARRAHIDASSGAVTTFIELEARTNALASSLNAHGVRRGDRVALMTLNSPQMMEIYYAVAKLGAISVPINCRLTATEVRYILADSGASIVFESSVFSQTVAAACEEGTIVRERFRVPLATERAQGLGLDHEDLISQGSPARIVRDISHDEVCVLMYTSGTTGQPKGAMLTHGNFQWNAIHAFSFGAGIGREDVTVSAAPMFHIGALGVHTLPFGYIGACTVIMESFTPETWLDAAETYRATATFLVPAMWSAVAQAESLSRRDLGAMKVAVSGGAPCPLVVIESLQGMGIAFTEGFGMTETAPNAACLAPEDVLEHAGSVGRPVPHMDFRIMDEEGQDMPTDTVGELALRGTNVFVGYWNKPAETAAAFSGEWFHTGDLARVDAQGFYTLVDRKKDMIITGGENVYPIEVEQAIYQHPDVREVAVVGVPNDKWGETVVAVVVVHTTSRLAAEDLVAWTRERVAHFKSPRTVTFVDELPRTATGKVLKRELRRSLSGVDAAVSR